MRLDKKYFHDIQLKKIQMVSLKSTYNEKNEGIEKKSPINININNGAKVTGTNKGVCYLRVEIGASEKENELFNIEVIYKGYCESSTNIDERNLRFYLEVQSIPMLWAYARETINNTIIKMGLPPVILPAVNINEIIGEISKKDEMEEN
ncbi:hypothetical protein CDLVIII_1469 [Clostridium sp. DL-VIII]|uniref:protein-export chaperone SecB n=1 Tax=Clostridium sp. DL-VIII TaxID=641107 RepID=UPI00023AF0A6|nr:protein-export chaperone SecB [Clostridium sp. DL-VIII]EHI98162.1 hypothetical protein CDLVIII_1469 [Clostridium sp. DL-VIII]